jgi:hypothetical protein
MSNAKCIPSREELQEFVVLLRRYSVASLTAFRACRGEFRGLRENFFLPIDTLGGEIWEKIRTSRFLVPHGWPDGLDTLFRAIRRGEFYFRPGDFRDPVPIAARESKGKTGSTSNPKRAVAEAMLDGQGRLISELESLLAARRQSLPSSRPGSDREIIDTLRSVGYRCTTKKLLQEMTNRRLNPSDSTIKKRLAGLVQDGVLDKDAKAVPPGYGLLEWTVGSSGS